MHLGHAFYCKASCVIPVFVVAFFVVKFSCFRASHGLLCCDTLLPSGCTSLTIIALTPAPELASAITKYLRYLSLPCTNIRRRFLYYGFYMPSDWPTHLVVVGSHFLRLCSIFTFWNFYSWSLSLALSWDIVLILYVIEALFISIFLGTSNTPHFSSLFEALFISIFLGTSNTPHFSSLFMSE